MINSNTVVNQQKLKKVCYVCVCVCVCLYLYYLCVFVSAQYCVIIFTTAAQLRFEITFQLSYF